MNLPLAVAVVCLALLGTAEARLGETIKEIEKRYGKPLTRSERGFDDLPKGISEKVSMYSIDGEEGFDDINFIFSKKEGDSARCLAITYYKEYEARDADVLTPADAMEIFKRNFPNFPEGFSIRGGGGHEDCFKRNYSVLWGPPLFQPFAYRGSAEAGTGLTEKGRLFFLAECISREADQLVPEWNSISSWKFIPSKDENGLILMEFARAAGDLIIPEKPPTRFYRNSYPSYPSSYNDKPVTEIADSIFSGFTNLTSVMIPDSIQKIGSSAFANCTNLTNVIGGRGVKEIGGEAFEGCQRLTKIALENVTFIGVGAFAGCTALSEITIPKTVSKIGYSAFDGCTGLTNVIVPGSVSTIESGTFFRCFSLSRVVLGSGVKRIEYAAFQQCPRLTDVVIPESVTYIDPKAFDGCFNLNPETRKRIEKILGKSGEDLGP